jgi:ATP-dependent Lon protease
VVDIISGNMPFAQEVKQDILETLQLQPRYNKLNKALADLIKQLILENSIRDNIQLEIDEDQKRYFLREQMEAIKRELGEVDDIDQELQKWVKKISGTNLPEHVYDVAKEELSRMSMMAP